MDFDYFNHLLHHAQSGDNLAVEELLREFKPLIEKYQFVNRHRDEDLLSELLMAAYLCILRFQIDKKDLQQFLAEARGIITTGEAANPSAPSTAY